MPKKLNAIVTAGLSDKKIITKLYGLANCQKINSIYLIRRTPVTTKKTNIYQVNPPQWISQTTLIYEVWRLYAFIKIILKKKIHFFYAIQLIPHSFHTYLWSILSNKPVILSVIGDDVHIYLNKPFIGFILKHIIGQAQFITVLGEQSSQKIVNLGFRKENIIKILNFIDEKEYQPKLQTSKQWDLVYTGDLVKIKNLSILIEVFADLILKHPELQLCIIGNGPEKKLLTNLVQKLNLCRNILFVDKTPDVTNYLNQSRALIMTSKSEALPASAIEAAFCGLPTILPNVGDIPSLFSHKESSLIYSQGNKDELYNILLKLFNTPELYQTLQKGALKLRKNYIKQWSIKRQSEIWDSILVQIKN